MRLERAVLRRSLLALALSPLLGCSLPATSKGPPAQGVAPAAYDSASVTYRLDARRLNLPLAVMRIDHQQVSYDDMPSTPASESTTGTLNVDFPDPEAPPGYARAKVTIASGTSASKPTDFKPGWHYGNSPLGAAREEPTESDHPKIQEVWVLDLPKADFDRALEGLRRQNYFNPGNGVAGGSELTAKLGGRETKKPWVQVPEFDVLMQRVRREGQLISYTRPPVAARMAAAPGLMAVGPPAVQPFSVDPRMQVPAAAGTPSAPYGPPGPYPYPAPNPYGAPPSGYTAPPAFAPPAGYVSPAAYAPSPAYAPSAPYAPPVTAR